MDTETLPEINTDLFSFVTVLIQNITLMADLIVIVTLGSIAWLCFAEGRKSAKRQDGSGRAASAACVYDLYPQSRVE